MNRPSPRASRRVTASAVVALALLAFGAFPGVVSAVTPTCNGLGATIVGRPGQTAIRGTQGPDVIVALEDGVRIDSRGGDDTICAGPGDNIINGGAGDDWIQDLEGANTIDLGAGANTAFGGPGNDTILGGTGNDTVNAGDGDNLVSLGAGDDVIRTGSGNDRIDGAKGYDLCDPGTGTDDVGHCEGQLGASGPGDPPTTTPRPDRPRRFVARGTRGIVATG